MGFGTLGFDKLNQRWGLDELNRRKGRHPQPPVTWTKPWAPRSASDMMWLTSA